MGNDLRHRPDHLTHITFLKVKWRLTRSRRSPSHVRVPRGFDQHSKYDAPRRGPFTQTSAGPAQGAFQPYSPNSPSPSRFTTGARLCRQARHRIQSVYQWLTNLSPIPTLGRPRRTYRRPRLVSSAWAIQHPLSGSARTPPGMCSISARA